LAGLGRPALDLAHRLFGRGQVPYDRRRAHDLRRRRAVLAPHRAPVFLLLLLSRLQLLSLLFVLEVLATLTRHFSPAPIL
jgi:hypothetical protein